MSRRRTEINTIRGKRLRTLLLENNMDQKLLAEKIGYTKEHISYIINGRRNLTADAAELIVKLFPTIRFEWLMGYDNFKTEEDFKSEPIRKLLTTVCDKRIAFSALLYSLGYDKEVLDHSDYANLTISNAKIDNIIKMSSQIDRVEYCILKNGEEVGRCSAVEYELLLNEVFEFAEFKIKKICEGGNKNG